MRPFQIILVSLFGALAIGGLIMFATFRGFSGDNDPMRNGVTIWGTLDDRAFTEVLGDISAKDQKWGKVKYYRKDQNTFVTTLVNAIAEGTGPDMIVLPQDLIVLESTKIQPISYAAYSERTFKDSFVDGASVFALPAGIYGIPFAVDPLMMYWNRNTFSSAGFAYPPRTWEELVSATTPALTLRTDANDIKKSAVAFGEYSNIQNAKAVLLMLLLQAGSTLVTITDGTFHVDLNINDGRANVPPADAALRFYTQFSNPTKTTYSWNRAQKNDRDMFLSEDLALYFGFGSEYHALAAGNANINFDVTEVPQVAQNGGTKRGYGTFYAFAIPKSAKNPSGAYEAAQGLALGAYTDSLIRKLGLAPARRDLIAAGNGTASGDVIYRAALVAHAWLDPNPQQSDNIFKDMIEAVTSGRSKISEVIDDATYKLQQAF